MKDVLQFIRPRYCLKVIYLPCKPALFQGNKKSVLVTSYFNTVHFTPKLNGLLSLDCKVFGEIYIFGLNVKSSSGVKCCNPPQKQTTHNPF